MRCRRLDSSQTSSRNREEALLVPLSSHLRTVKLSLLSQQKIAFTSSFECFLELRMVSKATRRLKHVYRPL